ncbi:cytochrome c peroxidase [Mitsuaria sp. GD03876]|uniref:cytochrome-c peroxidase n=1 Tax=Mitsuaria sp. GD03876 TaxID=2975399 RepID=UPI00244D3093|nr:cytochrome c peroxidase [Mitsuaria sp. GD03876]MDH0866972.1 c-type cytochrome [Mitsuaria sp. GD03876]
MLTTVIDPTASPIPATRRARRAPPSWFTAAAVAGGAVACLAFGIGLGHAAAPGDAHPPAPVPAAAVVKVATASPSASATAARPFYATAFERKPDANALTELGRKLFFDKTLSASGAMACASCHDPAHAYGPPNALPVQPGGASGAVPGLRAVPSLMYRQQTPQFSERFFDNDGDDSLDQGPTGGFAWDGRAASAHEQAEAPLLSPFEMANTDRGAVVRRMAGSPNAAALREAFGPRLFDDAGLAWNALVLALEVFQQNPKDFAPFSSRYDAYLRGKGVLTPQEARGLALFEDKGKGNCASCHVSVIKRGAFPLFTDMGHIAIGVPRNPAIPANRDPAFHDLGTCGPLRTDLKDHPEYCGLFKTPSLRNVATRRVFFHNGAMRSLEEAVRFYALRDTDPARVYGRDAKGRARKDADLPAKYEGNLNRERPFGGEPGDKPSLSEPEIRDIVAFLKTLDDVPPAALASTGKGPGGRAGR